jgi:hypothetical protein
MLTPPQSFLRAFTEGAARAGSLGPLQPVACMRGLGRSSARAPSASGHLPTLNPDRKPLGTVCGRIHVRLLRLPLCFRVPELGCHRLDRPASRQRSSQVRQQLARIPLGPPGVFGPFNRPAMRLADLPQPCHEGSADSLILVRSEQSLRVLRQSRDLVALRPNEPQISCRPSRPRPHHCSFQSASVEGRPSGAPCLTGLSAACAG